MRVEKLAFFHAFFHSTRSLLQKALTNGRQNSIIPRKVLNKTRDFFLLFQVDAAATLTTPEEGVSGEFLIFPFFFSRERWVA